MRREMGLDYLMRIYRIRGNFRGLPIFAVFRGQYESAKIKSRNIFIFLSKNRR